MGCALGCGPSFFPGSNLSRPDRTRGHPGCRGVSNQTGAQKTADLTLFLI